MVDFNTLLDTKADEIEPPKALPSGEYTLEVTGYLFDESSQKKTPYVEYGLQPQAPGDDVDEDLLAEVENWQNKKLRVRFYITESALFMLTDFLENACGLEVTGKSLKELIPEAVGSVVVGTVTQQESENTGRVFNPEVRNFQPVE